jgi:hypothetical protein
VGPSITIGTFPGTVRHPYFGLAPFVADGQLQAPVPMLDPMAKDNQFDVDTETWAWNSREPDALDKLIRRRRHAGWLVHKTETRDDLKVRITFRRPVGWKP